MFEEGGEGRWGLYNGEWVGSELGFEVFGWSGLDGVWRFFFRRGIRFF